MAKKKVQPLKLTGKLFYEWRIAMAEMSEARTTLKLREILLREEMQKPVHEPLLKRQVERDEALRGAAEKQTQYKQVQARICKRLGVAPEEIVKYTINEFNGSIVFTPPKGEE